MSLPTAADISRKLLAGRRVLVVEDEYFLADDIAHALAAVGAQIIGPIADIEEAETLLRQGETVDAAVLDVNVRSKMIFSLAHALRARQIPFVFATGYDRISLDMEFQDVPVWEKPLDLSNLARSLAGMLAK